MVPSAKGCGQSKSGPVTSCHGGLRRGSEGKCVSLTLQGQFVGSLAPCVLGRGVFSYRPCFTTDRSGRSECTQLPPDHPCQTGLLLVGTPDQSRPRHDPFPASYAFLGQSRWRWQGAESRGTPFLTRPLRRPYRRAAVGTQATSRASRRGRGVFQYHRQTRATHQGRGARRQQASQGEAEAPEGEKEEAAGQQ